MRTEGFPSPDGQYFDQGIGVSDSIHQAFVWQVQRQPDAIALILPSVDPTLPSQQLTYQALHQRSDQLALQLQQHGVEPGDIVALAMPRSLEVVVALLGILKAGAGYLPLDLSYPAERLAFMLQDAQPKVLITQGELPAIAATCPIFSLEPDGETASTSAEFRAVPTTAESLAYINYTSGSTGQPKGVMIPHRGVLRLVYGNTYATFGTQTRFLQLAPLAFDAATFEIWGALLNGGCCVLFPAQGLPDFDTLGQVLATQSITTLWLTASLFNTLVAEAPHILAPVREILTGGEALSLFHVRKALSHLPQTQLINGYGPTESTTFTCCYRIPAQLPADATTIPIGQAIAQTETYILDESYQPVPSDTAGELYIGGAGLALGYLNRPELTAERFIQNPFNPSTRLYKTGDRVRLLADGNLEFLGRVDHQIKLRGYRIELAEIEQALVQHPQVAEAVVMRREDRPGDPYLAAYVTAGGRAQIDLQELKHDLKAQLPPYMVPTVMMDLAAFPLTPNGKVDRQAFPQPEVTPVGVATTPLPGDLKSLETAIAQIWRDVLGVNALDIHATFNDLGGTSLQALQIAHRLQQQLGQRVRTVDLYQAPTVHQLAHLLASAPEHPSEVNRANARSQTTDIAIIGMVGRFPGANSVTEFWDNLCAGVESITQFQDHELDPSIPPAIRQDPAYVKAKGILSGAETFDAAFFGISPREAEILDPQARVFLELTLEALETTGYVPDQYPGQIGLFAGCGQNTYFARHLCGRPDLALDEFQLMLANEKDFLTTRASYKLNLKGPSVSVNTACSTSLVAVIQAAESLISQQCDLAIAGGVSISTPQNQGYLYNEGSIYSADGHCRPFDAAAQGTVFSNGAGLVVLKRLDEAQRDRDRVYAVIKGYGLNNDGADKVSFTAPSIPGQVAAIMAAQARSGFEAETISYIECHGTATPIGDPIEVEALQQAFRTQTAAQQFCALGSLKGNVGHLVAAAGVAGLIKTALALHHRQIPPSLHYQTPNPEIDFANSPFYVNAQLTDWQAPLLRAGVSALGVGGTNAHVLLEAAPSSVTEATSRSAHLLSWSAKTPSALQAMTQRLQQYLAEYPDANLADVAYTLHVGRAVYPYRQSLVVRDRTDALERLAALDSELEPSAHPVLPPQPVVFMFPGQGAQSPRMGQQLYEQEPVFRQWVDECARILHPRLRFDVREMLYPATTAEPALERSLYHTPNTQIGLFVVEYALAKLWQSWGIEASAYIGHSIGEFVAACLAGIFSLEDALRLVAARGALMEGLPPGGMLAVSLSEADLAARLPAGLAIAAVNSPMACVVSGAIQAIEAFQDVLLADEIACRRLHTAHAFHSPMMADRVAPLAMVLESLTLHPPTVPLISTVTGTWMTEAEATHPQYWAHHLVAPVQFAAGVETLWCQSNRVLLEVGPRSTLTTLARQQGSPSKWAIASLAGATTPDLELRSLLQAIAQLSLVGIQPDWSKFYARESRQRIPLPTYPFERQRYWIDPPPVPDLQAAPGENTVVESKAQSQTATKIYASGQAMVKAMPPSIPMTLQNLTNGSRKQELRRSLHLILQEASGLDSSQIEDRASFFELGLDSLSLTQVSLAIKKKLNLKITFRQLLEDYTTLASLVEFADQTLPRPHPATHTPIAEPTSLAEISAAPPVPSLPSPVFLPDSGEPISAQNVEQIIEQQLKLMARQLEILGQTAQPHANGKGHNGQATPSHPRPSHPTQAKVSAVPPSDPDIKPAAPAPRTRIQRQVEADLTPQQQAYLDRFIERYTAKTTKSKQQAQMYRAVLADPRTVSGFSPRLKEMVYPIVTVRSQGAQLWDIDGNTYVDLVNGFGLNFFGWSPPFMTEAIQQQLQQGYEIGPQTPLVGEVAQRLSRMTGYERVVFCNTGSEAVMASLRLARTVTGRNRVALFAGAYHGTFDEVVIRAGHSGKGLPGAPGILPSMTENALVLDYGTPESLEMLRHQADDLAAILVEPVQSRRPDLQPREFLHELRQLTQRSETALIFDEVVTGFRVAPGGVQEYFGIQADMATYGKIIGGGLPIGVLAGKSTYMDALDGGYWQYGDTSIPEVGVTFFAGTFVRHPLAIAAADAVLQQLEMGGAELQRSLSAKVAELVGELQAYLAAVQAPIQIHHFSSFFYVSYPAEVPYASLLFYLLRAQGIHIWEHRPCFLTLAHSEADIRAIVEAFKSSIAELITAGLIPGQMTAANAIPSTFAPFRLDSMPHQDARLGRDLDGNPTWYIPDPQRPGQYLQLH